MNQKIPLEPPPQQPKLELDKFEDIVDKLRSYDSLQDLLMVIYAATKNLALTMYMQSVYDIWFKGKGFPQNMPPNINDFFICKSESLPHITANLLVAFLETCNPYSINKPDFFTTITLIIFSEIIRGKLKELIKEYIRIWLTSTSIQHIPKLHPYGGTDAVLKKIDDFKSLDSTGDEDKKVIEIFRKLVNVN